MGQTSEMEWTHEQGWEEANDAATPALFLKDLEIDSFQDGVLALDFENRVIAVNRAMTALVPGNWSVELPCRVEKIFPAMSEELAWVGQMLKERVCLHNHVLQVSRQGKTATLLADSCYLRDIGGELVGVCLFIKDIGNLLTLEKQVQHNEKLATVGKIAAGVAHEIRNPLTSVKGFLQMMSSELEKNGMRREQSFTKVMLDEIERINGLVGELLLLSKPRELRMEHIDMGDLIAAMAPLIESETLLHDIQFRYECGPVPPVQADREGLKQVFYNLVKNAIDAMSEMGGGTLSILMRYEEEGRRVRVEVRDTGPGIPHYLLDRIFDAFFTTKETGTGLGLPIAQRLINDVGGKIKVTSKGFGTTVTVELPALYSF